METALQVIFGLLFFGAGELVYVLVRAYIRRRNKAGPR
jgi:hypothetical protein